MKRVLNYSFERWRNFHSRRQNLLQYMVWNHNNQYEIWTSLNKYRVKNSKPYQLETLYAMQEWGWVCMRLCKRKRLMKKIPKKHQIDLHPNMSIQVSTNMELLQSCINPLVHRDFFQEHQIGLPHTRKISDKNAHNPQRPYEHKNLKTCYQNLGPSQIISCNGFFRMLGLQ